MPLVCPDWPLVITPITRFNHLLLRPWIDNREVTSNNDIGMALLSNNGMYCMLIFQFSWGAQLHPPETFGVDGDSSPAFYIGYSSTQAHRRQPSQNQSNFQRTILLFSRQLISIIEKMHNSCQRTLLLFKTRCSEDIENKGCHSTTSVNTMRAAQPSHHSVFVIVQSLPCFRMTFQKNPCLRILAGLVRTPLTACSILSWL